MSEWFEVKRQKPPQHQQVLVELRDGPGQVCDVACYVGLVQTDVGTEDRWLLADVRLESKQIVRWAHIYPQPPADVIGKLEARIAELEAA